MARSNNNDCAEIYFQQGSCNIILKQGDLLAEADVDAIVIPTPEYGQQASHSYPIFEALCSKVDQRLRGEINRFSSKIIPGGDPQIIWSNKPSIILTPTPYYRNEKKAFQLLKSTYLACLNLAVNENKRTIAFPTIGCGKSGFKTADAADNLYKALAQFEQSGDKQLNEIRIIIYDSNIFNEFINVFMELAQERNAKIKLLDMYELLFNKPRFTAICSFYLSKFRLIFISCSRSSKNSNSTEMPQKKNERQISQQQSRDGETNE